ncbi:amino acid ABC transporter substrate-binding protein [Fundidesulfovibrio putealis]|uniref:amino acid ABC transporter substrate-binding protein n=1 Tax=Fundidesulfovibrio putealis TaxID=270496 RepID=UPI000405BF35|nr:amino acid ABC transporter substrate-binding protein [Fundidesulfovibrio putealis]
MRIFALLLLAFGALLAMAAQATLPERPLRVGASVSRSGSLAQAGEMYEKGLRLWQRDVNARGGIQGRQVELVLHDDASTPEKAAEAYADLIDDKKADVILGPADNSLALAMVPVLERTQTPCLFAMPASDSLWKNGKGLVFSVLAPMAEWPDGFFELIARAGYERMALIIVDHPQGERVRTNTAKWIRRYGLRLVSESMIQVRDVAQALEQARHADAEVVTVWGTQEGCTRTIRLLKSMAWKPKAVYASTTMFQHNLHELSARDMNGVFTATAWEARIAAAYPGGSGFVAAFRSAYSQEPEVLAASAYASGQLLETALAKGGDKGRESLRKTLATLDTVTILGRFGVDAGGMQLRQFPLTEQWQKGKREIVWPDELKTAKPVLPR